MALAAVAGGSSVGQRQQVAHTSPTLKSSLRSNFGSCPNASDVGAEGRRTVNLLDGGSERSSSCGAALADVWWYDVPPELMWRAFNPKKQRPALPYGCYDGPWRSPKSQTLGLGQVEDPSRRLPKGDEWDDACLSVFYINQHHKFRA